MVQLADLNPKIEGSSQSSLLLNVKRLHRMISRSRSKHRQMHFMRLRANSSVRDTQGEHHHLQMLALQSQPQYMNLIHKTIQENQAKTKWRTRASSP